MDEMSWRARLAKSNINILNIDEGDGHHDTPERWFYEFMYHPKPGQTKWSKTFYETKRGCDPECISQEIKDEVLKLRKELED